LSLGLAAVVGLVLTIVGLSAYNHKNPVDPGVAAGFAAENPSALEPSGVASPKYLTRDYVAPKGTVAAPGSAGELRVPSLGIDAPVAETHLDGEVMAVPNDTHEVGWLNTTASFQDAIGATVIAGHVANDANTPGALWPLKDAKVGTEILWTQKGVTERYKVVSMAFYDRATGLPPSVFNLGGAHVLNLITCATRIVYPDGSWHYTQNLVVTAELEGSAA
jgi:sortase (surface protein transpeptidase)